MKVTSTHQRQTGQSKADEPPTLPGFAGLGSLPVNSVPAVGSPDPERTRQPLRGNGAASTTNDSFRRSK